MEKGECWKVNKRRRDGQTRGCGSERPCEASPGARGESVLADEDATGLSVGCTAPRCLTNSATAEWPPRAPTLLFNVTNFWREAQRASFDKFTEATALDGWGTQSRH